MKQCYCCKVEKLEDKFFKKSSNLDGLYSYCKECTLKKNKENYKESYAEQQKKYKEKNRDLLNQKAKDYYKNNREKCLIRASEYKKKNIERIRLRDALKRISEKDRFEKNRKNHFEWSKDNRERLNDYQRKWYQKNKEKRRAHVILHRAVGSGAIMRPKNCSECKKKCKPDGHHIDYSKPLDVIWICRACHSRKSPRTVIK